MLWEGARVYLHDRNPTYRWFLDKGAHVDSMQSLCEYDRVGKVELSPLSKVQRENNAKAIMDHWERARQHERTRALIDKALGRVATRLESKSSYRANRFD